MVVLRSRGTHPPHRVDGSLGLSGVRVALHHTRRFTPLADRLRASDAVILTTHAGPDGDGLGSVVALSRALRRAGKRTAILLPDRAADRYAFLDPEGQFLVFPEGCEALGRESWDLGLVVDTHQPSQLRGVDVWLREAGIPLLYFDHHPVSAGFGGEIYGDPRAVAAGCLVYHLLQGELGWEIDREIAEPLYISISYDTNSFKYLRNDPEALEICADLVRRGVDTTWVYRNLFASNPLRKARVLGWVLSHLEFQQEGVLALVAIPHAVIAEHDVQRDDLREAVTQILEIDGVEIAVVLKEMSPGDVKISLRSKGRFVINDVAAALGGGGHPLAAGCEFVGDLESAWNALGPRLLAVIAGEASPAPIRS